MKAFILNGSPRTNGDTRSLINKFIEKIGSEYRMQMLIGAIYHFVLITGSDGKIADVQ